MVNTTLADNKMEYEIWIGADENTVKEYRELAAKKLGSRIESEENDAVLTSNEDNGDNIR